MANAATKKIVVCGGNGFLGSRICKAATARGWDVTSISRSGEPTWSAVTSSSTAPSWSSSVNWVSANILQPSTYRQHLSSADAVIHTMGILLEADYKGVLTGKEPIYSGLARAFSSSKLGTANPLEKSNEDSDLEPLHEGGQITYEVMNRDTALLLAREAQKADVKNYLYISAMGGAPILPGRYIKTKREAEKLLEENFPEMRSIFFRPGFLFDSSRAFTVPLAYATFPVAVINSALGGAFEGLLGAGVAKPLKADTVAAGVVEALADEGVRGPVEIKGIEELANKTWRRGML
ncbi:hypothetical protein BT93_L0383 [Corymbia citriodora subsp. variegata]|uniref:NAD-dependent epimerase/dehydratase domain-containing protein n=1 Tax=Corymbia citriodora subsp. variegata TaxID=360336 RepID=A0A8T0CES9_CORYI|nr:hypothetical protein BT93_L0383 [Corymbia citriodora subsp. variegata]